VKRAEGQERQFGAQVLKSGKLERGPFTGKPGPLSPVSEIDGRKQASHQAIARALSEGKGGYG